MKITKYLIHTATFQERTGEDRWGKQTFAATTTIKVRRSTKQKLLKTQTGHELIPVTQYMTEQTIKLGDRIDGQEIQGVESIEDFKGTIGWKAFPRAPSGFAGSGG